MSVEMLDVPVDGGSLRVGRWGSGAPVLAIHGITSSHLAWAEVARLVPDLVAPDLRGRGGSAALPGPWGMARHADDMARVLDAVGAERVTVVGHSMGGFVAVVLAQRHPDRVARLVLVDGGLTIPVPPTVPVDDLLQAVIGPAAERLAMTFPSVEAHREFWRAHPAMGPAWSEAVEAYVDYDLTGEPPALRSRALLEAVQADSIDIHSGAEVREAMTGLRHPTVFLRAERGLLDQPQALYPEGVAEAIAARMPTVTVRTVPGTNHYTIVMSPAGAAVVAAALA